MASASSGRLAHRVVSWPLSASIAAKAVPHDPAPRTAIRVTPVPPSRSTPACSSLRRRSCRCLRRVRRAWRSYDPSKVNAVQATVAAWSATTRGGSVLLDDGRSLDFDHAVFDASGLRLLRFGQRVRIKTRNTPDGKTVVTALTIATLPWPDGR